MVKTIVALFTRWRTSIYEVAGAALVVTGIAQVSTWGAIVAGGIALLLKSLELDLRSEPKQ